MFSLHFITLSCFNTFQASNEERAFKPIVGDVELVRQQQEEFRSFKQELIIPLGQNVEEANRSGQGLVQSAANGVSTTALESDLEKMNDRWNNLKEKLNDRERRLDVAFLQSGKFQEALQVIFILFFTVTSYLNFF